MIMDEHLRAREAMHMWEQIAKLLCQNGPDLPNNSYVNLGLLLKSSSFERITECTTTTTTMLSFNNLL
jgi:hypothetical protein